MTIAAIETRYAGCRFRSRLEARWAVFFEHVGIGWNYEPQGFRLSNGLSYLPDFLLDCGSWVEVKGDEKRLNKADLMQAARDLPSMPYAQEQGPSLLILGYIPDPTRVVGDFGWVGLSRQDDDVRVDRYGLSNYRKNQRPWWLDGEPFESDWLIPTLERYEPLSREAYKVARSARFEHGACG